MLTRRGPERGVPLRSALEWFFQDPWQEVGRWQGSMMPSIDVRETDDAYEVEAEMPGVKPEDIEVTLEGNTLLIRGQFQKEDEKKSSNGDRGRYLVRERESATYARAISLPGGVDGDKVSTTYEHGELKITLPKAASMRARRIPVSGGASSAKQVGDSSSSSGQSTSNYQQPTSSGQQTDQGS